MGHHVCPVWIGYLLLSPLRKIFESPEKRLGPFVSPGITVLEPGCGMGYFTLPLAQMVGTSGKVVAADIQEKMLAKVRKRAAKSGLDSRIETRLATGDSLAVDDLASQVDFAAALHLVHELPDQASFFEQIYGALKPGGRFLVVEPKGHVSAQDFAASIDLAKLSGFTVEGKDPDGQGRYSVLVK